MDFAHRFSYRGLQGSSRVTTGVVVANEYQRTIASRVQSRRIESELKQTADAARLLECLPAEDTIRWVVRRKADVIAAIRGGVISRADACARYKISEDELCLWERAIDAVGIRGLRVTRVQAYRSIFKDQ